MAGRYDEPSRPRATSRILLRTQLLHFDKMISTRRSSQQRRPHGRIPKQTVIAARHRRRMLTACESASGIACAQCRRHIKMRCGYRPALSSRNAHYRTRRRKGKLMSFNSTADAADARYDYSGQRCSQYESRHHHATPKRPFMLRRHQYRICRL